MFINKLKLSFLVLCCSIGTTNLLKTNPEISDIQNATKAVKKLGQETLNFLDNLNESLPQLVQEIAASKSFSMTFIRTILSTYSNIKITDLFELTVLQQNEMDKRLIPLLICIVIEFVHITSISNLENKKIYMPLKNSQNYNEKVKEITRLTQIIEDYVDKISKKTKTIKDNLRNTLKDQFSIDLPEIESLNLESNKSLSQGKNSSFDNLLEKLNYKEMLEELNIKKDELIEEFTISIRLISEHLLSDTDINTLKILFNGTTFQKIKKETTINKFKEFVCSLSSNLPSTAKDTFNWAKNAIFTKTAAA